MSKIPPSILRQPPPPRSRMAAINEDEGNTEMAEGNCTRTFYLRRCKRKRLTGMESLPDELLFEVLVRLPAQDIYDPARLVCRKWYHMIHTHNFIYAHLQHTTYGLLFQCTRKDSFFMAVREGRIEISKFKYKFRYEVKTSCNGLLLEFEEWNHNNAYISNPATSQIFVLPPKVGGLVRYGIGIAYAAATMEYKVVMPYPVRPNSKGLCYILTVGADNSWRTVRTEHLSYEAMRAFIAPPLLTEGFVHWCSARDDGVLTLNAETEIIKETPAPVPRPVLGGGRSRNIFLSAGRYLSMFVFREEFFWDVWEMKPETGEWRKVRSISLDAERAHLNE